MLAASGDPYIDAAVAAGVVPSGSTKQTHPEERQQFKTDLLAMQYGAATAAETKLTASMPVSPLSVDASANKPLPAIFANAKKARGAAKTQADPRDVDIIVKPLTTLTIQKPKKSDFIRTFFDGYVDLPSMRMFEATKPGERYPTLHWLDESIEFPEEIVEKAIDVTLVLYATHGRQFFLWPLKEGDYDFATSAVECAKRCLDEWLSVRSAESSYYVVEGRNQVQEVDWSRVGSAAEVVEASLKAVAISSIDHPAIRFALGEMIAPEESKASAFRKRFNR